MRGCGKRLSVPTFQEVHGLKPFMIAPTAIIRGVGETFGFETFDVEGATGYYNSNYTNKIKKAVELIQLHIYDFGFVHFKAVDDAGHDKNIEKKVEMLEKVDKAIGEFLELTKDENIIICVTGDHTTPVKLGDHTYEAVPILVSSN